MVLMIAVTNTTFDYLTFDHNVIEFTVFKGLNIAQYISLKLLLFVRPRCTTWRRNKVIDEFKTLKSWFEY